MTEEQKPKGREVDPTFNPHLHDTSDLLHFRHPENRKKAKIQNLEIARLDPSWSIFDTN